MNSELSDFAARLRELIPASLATRGDVESQTRNSELGTRNFPFPALARELFALQFAANPAYRKLCEARRVTPLTISDWTQIPAVPTAAFKELEVTCLPAAQRAHVFHSSGTTGQQPSRHFHSAESLAVYEASLWTWFQQNLRMTNSELRLAILTPPPGQTPHSSLVHMFEFIRKKLGAPVTAFFGRSAADSSWTLDFDSVITTLADESELGTHNPKLILGTAFSLVHLLDHLGNVGRQLRLPPGSRVMETGGYKGRSRAIPKTELHVLITQRLGVPPAHIICEYGMSELSSQAYDAAAGGARGFHFPPWARVQIISPETGREVADGETGLIRVFDLANVFSVMAIQTEDLAVRRGDGFELIGRAVTAEPRGCSLMAM